MLDFFDDMINRPRVSVKMEDTESNTVFKIALPGLSKDSIELIVKEDRLLVNVLVDMGFVAIQEYYFQLPLGAKYLLKNTEVSFENGLLIVTIPKDIEKVDEYKVIIS